MLLLLNAPSVRLLIATFFALLGTFLALWLATQQPWYGMQRVNSKHQSALFLVKDEPLRVLAIKDDQRFFPLLDADLIEEPDALERSSELVEFLARQQLIFQLLQKKELTVQVKDRASHLAELEIKASPSRPITRLPLAFWVQLITGLGGFLVGCWVLVLRPKDLAARCFMLTGVGLFFSALSAAVYSSRELALSAGLFQSLLAVNQISAMGFAFALVGLFCYFPKQLVSPRLSVYLLFLFIAWLVVFFTDWISSSLLLVYLPIFLACCAIACLIAFQWWHNRQEPGALAALRWLGLVTLATISCFLILIAVPTVYGSEKFLSQGISFGFFLILYIGLAIGLRRYRLFDLDRWAYYLLLWVLAALALVVLDFMFLALLRWRQDYSLLASLLICGFLYFPLRAYLWRKLVDRPKPSARALFNAVVELALAPDASVFAKRWKDLLEKLYAPLHIEELEGKGAVGILDEGRALFIPAVADMPALRLELAEKAKRLFTQEDVRLAEEVLDMLHYAYANRNARELGEQEERKRIAQDLHDDLGSRLLTVLQQQDSKTMHDTVRLAIADMRGIVQGLKGEHVFIEQSLSDLRIETMHKFEHSDVALDWPLAAIEQDIWALSYRHNRHFLSIMRELFSNILRHAQATKLRVEISVEKARLKVVLINDGKPYDGSGERQGSFGMTGLFERVEAINGDLTFSPQANGTVCVLFAPLKKQSNL